MHNLIYSNAVEYKIEFELMWIESIQGISSILIMFQRQLICQIGYENQSSLIKRYDNQNYGKMRIVFIFFIV